MCKPASMIVMPQHRVFWSAKTDSHHEIIAEHNLREVDAGGFIGLVPVEICPPGGDLSLPLDQWMYTVDYADIPRELPDWYDGDKAEAACRSALVKWADEKLTGWRVHEAFHPIHPFKVEPGRLGEAELRRLLGVWASVLASVRDSAWASGWGSGLDSVRASVLDSVLASGRDSVRASVWAYIGSLFADKTEWIYTDLTDPWASLRELWINGYAPSFDGTIWRLHNGPDAAVVLEVLASELNKDGE